MELSDSNHERHLDAEAELIEANSAVDARLFNTVRQALADEEAHGDPDDLDRYSWAVVEALRAMPDA